MGNPLEAKISLGWISLDLIELNRRYRDPARRVAVRFIDLFRQHGVAGTQIQHFLSEITLDRLASPEALCPTLTNDVLNRTAMLFGVQRSWLAGVDERIYASRSCYKAPAKFFSALDAIGDLSNLYEVRAYCSSRDLDRSVGYSQLLVLVLAERIYDLSDDVTVLRFYPFTEQWDWSYGECRLQLKAIVRSLYKELHNVVRLHFVDASALQELAEGKRIPPDVPWLPGVSLEDYALSKTESGISKESDELPNVLSYMDEMRITEMAISARDRLTKTKTE